jgi:hypothetical protein
MKRMALVSLTALFLIGCQDSQLPTAPTTAPSRDISDGFLGGGNPDFFFRPPLSNPKPTPKGELLKGLDPVVRVNPVDNCEAGSPEVEGVATEKRKHYQFKWKTSKEDAGMTFRVCVVIPIGDDELLLGWVDVALEDNPKGKKTPQDVDDNALRKAGSNVEVKFFIREGALFFAATGQACPEGADCTAALLDEDGDFVPLRNPAGAMIAFGDFPEGWIDPEDGPALVTIVCNTMGFEPGDGPLPTDLKQLPLFCEFDVFPDNPVQPFNLDVRIGVCQVDDNISGQGVYHPTPEERENLQLAMESGEGIVLLELADASELENCLDVDTPLPEMGSSGINGPTFARAAWRTVVAKLTPVAERLFAPRPLYAMRFSDGGVGGLTNGFASKINAVVVEEGEGPDLEITSLSIDQENPDEFDDLSYSVEVSNLGDVATSAFDVEVALLGGVCGESEGQIGSSKTHVVGDGLSAFGDEGDSEAFDNRDFGEDFDLEGSSLEPGNYCLRAEADPEEEVDDVDRVDNVNEFDFTVESGGEYD